MFSIKRLNRNELLLIRWHNFFYYNSIYFFCVRLKCQKKKHQHIIILLLVYPFFLMLCVKCIERLEERKFVLCFRSVFIHYFESLIFFFLLFHFLFLCVCINIPIEEVFLFLLKLRWCDKHHQWNIQSNFIAMELIEIYDAKKNEPQG